MESLRTPFFILALFIMGIVVVIELGATAILSRLDLGGGNVAVATSEAIRDSLQFFPEDIREQLEEVLGDEEAAAELDEIDISDLPGFAIRYLALIDGILFFTVALIGVALLLPDNLQGKIQGVVTLVFSVLIILAAIAMILAAIAAVTTMVILLLAIPFGTLVYLIKFGSFPRGEASAVLGLLLLLKFGFVVSLVVAQQRFLQGKGLVLIILTSFLAVIVVSFLHGLVPGILVSITDAIAAIVVAVLAVIWAVILLIGSIPAVLKAIKPA
ncbi:MAG: hypothetical protein L0331_31820 [Chloroflexi bacterium]|nr:hypothetical protein [Chloroflexota bacterium]